MSTGHFLRGQFFVDRGRFAEAATEFEAQLRLDPESGMAHGMLAQTLAHLSRFEPATFHAQETLRLLPASGWAHFVMGVVLFDQQRFADGENWVHQAIQLEPENAAYLQLLAALQSNQGRRTDALETIDRCLQLTPENIHVLNLRSALSRQEADHAAADRAAQQALALAPENALAHVNHALSFVAQGSYRKAFAEFREALRLDPHSKAAQAGIADTRSARAMTTLAVFLSLVAAFLAILSFNQHSSGCFELSIIVLAVLASWLFWRHAWPIISRSWR